MDFSIKNLILKIIFCMGTPNIIDILTPIIIYKSRLENVNCFYYFINMLAKMHKEAKQMMASKLKVWKKTRSSVGRILKIEEIPTQIAYTFDLPALSVNERIMSKRKGKMIHINWYNILGFIKNYNGPLNIYFHGSPNDWINDVVIWTKNQFCIFCHRTSSIIWTTWTWRECRWDLTIALYMRHMHITRK